MNEHEQSEKLWAYTKHLPSCNLYLPNEVDDNSADCFCGLNQLRKQWKALHPTAAPPSSQTLVGAHEAKEDFLLAAESDMNNAVGYDRQLLYKAVDEYAAQECRAFFEFGFNISSWDISVDQTTNAIHMKGDKTFTQLYNLYIQSKIYKP